MGRGLFSFEEKEEWLYNMRDLEHDGHWLRVTSDPYNWVPAVEQLQVPRWAVVFVDQGQTDQDRMAALRYLADRADFIVIHDTRNTWFARINEVLDGFEIPVRLLRHDASDVGRFK